MTKISLNTLELGSGTGSTQTVQLPTGTLPVFIVFGDSTSAGAESAATECLPEDRVYDEPYVGRTVGYIWNSWLTTADGVNFEAPNRVGTTTDVPGTAFEEAVPRGGGVTPLGSQPYGALSLVDPVWGLLRGLYGLFRDATTGDIIAPRIIRVTRTGSVAGEVASDAEKAFSWNAAYLDQTPGTPYDTYLSPATWLRDNVQAAAASFGGSTTTYLAGCITTAGFADTKTSYNTDPVDPATYKAAHVGDSLQDIREMLESEFGIDQFPMIVTGPHKVTGGANENTYDTIALFHNSVSSWAESYDMVSVVPAHIIQSPSGLYATGSESNPHFTGNASMELGRMWAQAYRNMLADPVNLVTAPRFTN